MESVLVKSIYNVDTISKGNTKAWIKLMDYMKTQTGNVLFDFKGIEVIQPWSTPEFKLFMQDERVHIKLWCNQQTVNSINIMCTLNGFTNNRAVNEDIVPVKVPTREEIQIEKMSTELQRYFDDSLETCDCPVLNVYRRFDQVGVPITVSYIEGALKKYASEHKSPKLKLEAKGIAVQASVIEALTSLIEKMNNVGVQLDIHSEDEEVMTKVRMYRSLGDKKVMSDKEKLTLIKASLHNGKVGMLVRYRESKAVDEFGRSGKGKPVSCRVAIYRGLKKHNGNICVCFRTYNGNTLFTKVHWYLEHDNEWLDALEYSDEIIPVEQFGMYNDFLGSRYHFITPVQARAEDSMTMYGVDNMGKVTYTKMTIPERIKAVFDDWDVEYDTESLQMYIQKTKELLR